MEEGRDPSVLAFPVSPQHGALVAKVLADVPLDRNALAVHGPLNPNYGAKVDRADRAHRGGVDGRPEVEVDPGGPGGFEDDPGKAEVEQQGRVGNGQTEHRVREGSVSEEEGMGDPAQIDLGVLTRSKGDAEDVPGLSVQVVVEGDLQTSTRGRVPANRSNWTGLTRRNLRRVRSQARRVAEVSLAMETIHPEAR